MEPVSQQVTFKGSWYIYIYIFFAGMASCSVFSGALHSLLRWEFGEQQMQVYLKKWEHDVLAAYGCKVRLSGLMSALSLGR